MMKIRIKMVSNEAYELSTNKYTTLNEWIKGNFAGKGIWWQPFSDAKLILMIDNIESVEVIE